MTTLQDAGLRRAARATICALIVAVACLAGPATAGAREPRLCEDKKDKSFKPAWIARSGYRSVAYVAVDQMRCSSARAAIRRGRSTGRDTFRTKGYRCRQTISNDYGIGLVRDVYLCTRGKRRFEFIAYQ